MQRYMDLILMMQTYSDRNSPMMPPLVLTLATPPSYVSLINLIYFFYDEEPPQGMGQWVHP